MPPPPPLLFAQPEGEARPGSAGNAALTAAANAATAAAARAPSRRVHGVSPGGCSGSPGTAPSSARLPRSAPAPPPPRPAHRRRRPPQPSPAPARARRAHAHLPPRASLGARSRPRGPGRLDHVAGRAPSTPPLPSCRVCRKQKAGGWPRSRAQGMRAGAAGPAHWGRRGARNGELGRVGAWRVQPACGQRRPARVGARECGSRGMFPPVAPGSSAGRCRLSTPRAQLSALLRALLGTLVLGPPYPRPAGGAPAAFSRDHRPGYFLGRPSQRGKEGIQRRIPGWRGWGFPEMGRDCRRQKTERVSKRGPLLRWGALGGPTAELETFLPRGSTTRGRVTPAP